MQLISTKGPTVNENRIVTKNGTELLVEWHGRFIRNPDGSLDYFFGIGIDITERKEAEDTLQWKTAFLEAQVNTSIDGILVDDEHHRRLIINQQFIDLWNVPRNVLDSKDNDALLDYIVEQTLYPQQVLEKVMYLYKNRDEISSDEIELKNGTVVDRYSAPVVGKDGHYYGRIWTFRDITERRRTQEALYESEIKYHSIVENAVEGIFQTTPDGRFLSVNPAQAKIFGYDSPYELMENISDISTQHYVNPEDRERFKQTLERKGLIKGFEAKLVGKKNRVVWASINAHSVKNADGRVAYYEGTLQDISDRKEAEQKLKESEETLSSLMNATDETLLLIDTDGTILTANKTTANRFGKEHQEIIGSTLYDFFPADIAASTKEHCDEVARTGKQGVFSVEMNGTFFETFTYPVFDDEGKVAKIAIFSKDVTERRKAEDNLRHLSIHDSLTGLFNRFFFEAELERLGTGRFDPVGIVICDVDGLKIVNDNLGHAMGDHQIVSAADLLKEQFRSSDIVARIGGDEFAILLPSCTPSIVEEIYRRLKGSMKNRYIPDTEIPLMMSVGYAVRLSSERPIGELLKEADQNMYDEKNRSRQEFRKNFESLIRMAASAAPPAS